jgi:hypothetical protein
MLEVNIDKSKAPTISSSIKSAINQPNFSFSFKAMVITTTGHQKVTNAHEIN